MSITEAQKSGFVTGIEGLNELFKGAINQPYMIVIAGHPGSGKTTLASKICYSNALLGYKCIYVTFYEDKEKLYRNLSKLGIHLKDIEEKGVFKYVKLPSSIDIEHAVDSINRILIEEKPDILVIDSISVLLDVVKDHAEKRAWLLNYFYALPNSLNGLLICIVELPFGEEKINMGSIEFTADAIIILKQRVEDGFLTRYMEIRKARGFPIYLAEIPFFIMENTGIDVFIPPVLSEISPQKEEILPACSVMRKVFGHYHRGFLINIFHPPEVIIDSTILLDILAMAIANNLKTLIISYLLPPSAMIDIVYSELKKAGINVEKIDRFFKEQVIVEGINPYSYNYAQLLAHELSFIKKVKPDIIVFHGVHVLTHAPRGFYVALYNKVNYLKSMNTVLISINAFVDEQVYRNISSIGDVNFRIEYFVKGNEISRMIYAWRRNKGLHVLTDKEISMCIDEFKDILAKHLK
ncbi:MAG: ATPase domain-containing protein [Desulfurococcaceae archaeon]